MKYWQSYQTTPQLEHHSMATPVSDTAPPSLFHSTLFSKEVKEEVQFSSVAQSCPTLQPRGLQHARLPCPSPTPGACSNLCPSSGWCLPTILSSVFPVSSCLNLSQHQGLFQWVPSSHQVAKILEFQLQQQSLQWIFSTDFLWNWLVWSLCSPRDSQESFPTLQFKSINSLVLSFLYGSTLTSIHDYWKSIALARQTFVGKVMSLLFNMLPRLVIAFLPRSKCL